VAEERAPLASVDALREELRRLGYLDSGLNRFVLSGARPGTVAAAAWSVAARVGVAGGLLLGAAFAVAAAALDRRLLAEPRDLLLLGAYLALAAGVVLAAAAFLLGVLAGWRGRRVGPPGQALPRNLGLLLAGLGLAYLVLWWRSHVQGAGLGAQAAVLTLSLLLALMLGRFGALAAVAVVSAVGSGGALPRASLSRRQMLPLLAAGTLLLGAGIAAARYLAARPEPPGPDFAVMPTGVRVLLAGVDGFEARMAAQMMGRGEMPRLASLVACGARGILQAEPEQVPASVWTTIATGRGPEAHGIRSGGARGLVGMRPPLDGGGEARLARALGSAADLLRLSRSQPATSALRGVKAMWNVASEKGLRVGVVNWWATWPAEPVNGYVVAGRAFLKLDEGEPFDREVHPPQAFERLRAARLVPEQDRARRVDRFHVEAARLLSADAPPHLEALYLSGLDVTTMQQLGGAAAADLATLDARLAAVRDYYRFVDGLIGELAERRAPDQVLVLVGDPGRLPRRGPQPPEGLLVLAGGPIVAGVELGAVGERDVAPTVLHLLGLPVSDELAGRVLESALIPSFRHAHPPRRVSAYGAQPRGAPAESAFDRQTLEGLKGLGYVQ
jgi:hypothetical protein